MRHLEAIRLVQWYHFQDEIFPIGNSCLLLGDNGSGKTTVLDAIQVALVADLSEVQLNRAANEKSQRTLHIRGPRRVEEIGMKFLGERFALRLETDCHEIVPAGSNIVGQIHGIGTAFCIRLRNEFEQPQPFRSS